MKIAIILFLTAIVVVLLTRRKKTPPPSGYSQYSNDGMQYMMMQYRAMQSKDLMAEQQNFHPASTAYKMIQKVLDERNVPGPGMPLN